MVRAAVEVASVKAQTQAIIRRLRDALSDLPPMVEELERAVACMPEDEVNDDVGRAGKESADG